MTRRAESGADAADETVRLLKQLGLTMATCDSLTGGGIGATITAVPGASEVFRGGLITYASDLKVSLAGVAADHVARHGVVNERTAKEMAVGAAWNCRADIGLSATGVAGPARQDGEPPGTVWLGLELPVRWACRIRARRLHLAGQRAEIRQQTICAALDWLNECLTESGVAGQE